MKTKNDPENVLNFNGFILVFIIISIIIIISMMVIKKPIFFYKVIAQFSNEK